MGVIGTILIAFIFSVIGYIIIKILNPKKKNVEVAPRPIEEDITKVQHWHPELNERRLKHIALCDAYIANTKEGSSRKEFDEFTRQHKILLYCDYESQSFGHFSLEKAEKCHANTTKNIEYEKALASDPNGLKWLAYSKIGHAEKRFSAYRDDVLIYLSEEKETKYPTALVSAFMEATKNYENMVLRNWKTCGNSWTDTDVDNFVRVLNDVLSTYLERIKVTHNRRNPYQNYTNVKSDVNKHYVSLNIKK